MFVRVTMFVEKDNFVHCDGCVLCTCRFHDEMPLKICQQKIIMVLCEIHTITNIGIQLQIRTDIVWLWKSTMLGEHGCLGLYFTDERETIPIDAGSVWPAFRPGNLHSWHIKKSIYAATTAAATTTATHDTTESDATTHSTCRLPVDYLVVIERQIALWWANCRKATSRTWLNYVTASCVASWPALGCCSYC